MRVNLKDDAGVFLGADYKSALSKVYMAYVTAFLYS